MPGITGVDAMTVNPSRASRPPLRALATSYVALSSCEIERLERVRDHRRARFARVAWPSYAPSTV